LPAALEHNISILVRVVFNEGILTGKCTVNSAFREGVFRKNHFAGDRLARAVKRVE